MQYAKKHITKESTKLITHNKHSQGTTFLYCYPQVHTKHKANGWQVELQFMKHTGHITRSPPTPTKERHILTELWILGGSISLRRVVNNSIIYLIMSYACVTCSLSLKKEHVTCLKTQHIFRYEISQQLRILHNKKCCGLYRSTSTIWIVKSRRL